MADVYLHPGKEKRVYSGHPWVFRSDIQRVDGACEPGEVVRVISSRGRFLAMAYYNPLSQISLRMLSTHEEKIDSAFVHRRVKEAIDYRRTFADLRSCRMVFAESDRLPALLPPGTPVAHKTGDLSGLCCGDAGIVYSPGGDYVLCAICNDQPYDAAARDAIAALSAQIWALAAGA